MAPTTKSDNTELDLLSRLPLHIAIYILSLLDAHSLLMASRVSRAWLALCRVTLVHARDYRDPWWLDDHNWSHLAALSEIFGGGVSGECRGAVGDHSSAARDFARAGMLLEVGGQLEEMRHRVRTEWRRFEVDISAQLELDPWSALQPDVLVGQLRNRGLPGTGQPRDV